MMDGIWGQSTPTWTPRCARQDITGTPSPGWLCGQKQTLTRLVTSAAILSSAHTIRRTRNDPMLGSTVDMQFRATKWLGLVRGEP